jgi:hypothetical protein
MESNSTGSNLVFIKRNGTGQYLSIGQQKKREENEMTGFKKDLKSA